MGHPWIVIYHLRPMDAQQDLYVGNSEDRSTTFCGVAAHTVRLRGTRSSGCAGAIGACVLDLLRYLDGWSVSHYSVHMNTMIEGFPNGPLLRGVTVAATLHLNCNPINVGADQCLFFKSIKLIWKMCGNCFQHYDIIGVESLHYLQFAHLQVYRIMSAV